MDAAKITNYRNILDMLEGFDSGVPAVEVGPLDAPFRFHMWLKKAKMIARIDLS
jgi:hypothetical protein